MSESHDALKTSLAALPEAPLPDGLWTKVGAAQRRRVRTRALRSGGLASLLVAALVAVPAMRLASHADAPQPGSVAQAAQVAASPSNGDEVRVLDRALQTAYDRGASDAEIAPMWVARNALLASLDAPGGAIR